MNDSRGFTITELMISVALLGAVIASAASFFIYQSGYGRTSATQKRTRENITLAMNMIRHDILHAGYGVNDRPTLALRLNNQDGDVYKNLYVNYGRFLSNEVTSSTVNVFSDYAYFEGDGGNSVSVDGWSGISFHPFESNKLMVESNDPLDLVEIQNGVVQTDTGQNMYAGTAYTPGISYTYDSTKKALLRNGEVILGGEPYFSVEDFQIRARFVVGTDDFWSPVATDTNKDFEVQDITNLRALEITTQYKMKMSEGASVDKSTLYSKTIQVAPRALVLQQQ